MTNDLQPTTDFLSSLSSALLSGAGSWWLGGIFLLFVTGFTLLLVASSLSLTLALIRHRKRALNDERIEGFRTYMSTMLSSGSLDPASKFALKAAWEALEGENNPYHSEVIRVQSTIGAGGDPFTDSSGSTSASTSTDEDQK